MKIYRAVVRNSEGKRGRVYFNAANIPSAQRHISDHFKQFTIVSIQEIMNVDLVINGLYNDVTELHNRINKAFRLRQEYTIEVQRLLAQKSKSHEELEEICQLQEYVAAIDQDMKMMRETVVGKQQLVKDLGEMNLAKFSQG